MQAMVTTITVTANETQVLVQDQSGDRLIARLPALSTSHRWALRTLLEALALWSEAPLRVVLSVDDSYDWERLGLADALGLGNETLLYEVEFVPHVAHSTKRPRRLRGLGRFTRQRQLLRVAGR